MVKGSTSVKELSRYKHNNSDLKSNRSAVSSSNVKHYFKNNSKEKNDSKKQFDEGSVCSGLSGVVAHDLSGMRSHRPMSVSSRMSN
jgi:hypothetical protein